MADDETNLPEVFPHLCNHEGCEVNLLSDDEPFCILHSPDSGSHFPGYSARRAAEQVTELEKRANVEHRNVFEDE